MNIEYHTAAWQCPECGWWIAVSRCKLGSHVRKCSNPNCKLRVKVEVGEITRTRTYLEKVILSQPVQE